MCIIVAVPRTEKLTYEIVENCFTNNSDGAGFMWSDGSKVYINKGYMKLAQIWADLQKVPENVDLVCHFRIATSGKINSGNCHPFPLIKDMKEMQRNHTSCEAGVAHNGIISFCAPNQYLQASFSDTMIFISDYLYKSGNAWKKQAVQKMIQLATNSKFAIMTHDKTHLIGDFQCVNGIYYSNSSYLKSKYFYSYDKDFETDYGNWKTHDYNYETGKYDIPKKKDTNLHATKEEVDNEYHKIIFPTKNPTDHLAKCITEDLEKNWGVFVEDYEVRSRMLVFTVVGLPLAKMIKGHMWKEVPLHMFNRLDEIKKNLETKKEEKQKEESDINE